MRQRTQRFLQSGLSTREFALEHELGLSTLQRWVRQHGARPSRWTPAPVAAFTELKLPSLAVAPRWVAELVRPNGRTLRLAPEAPAGLVGQLLRVC